MVFQSFGSGVGLGIGGSYRTARGMASDAAEGRYRHGPGGVHDRSNASPAAIAAAMG